MKIHKLIACGFFVCKAFSFKVCFLITSNNRLIKVKYS